MNCEVFRLKRLGPGSVSYYFYHEKKIPAHRHAERHLIQCRMIAGPWFDGQLAQYLYDIFGGTRTQPICMPSASAMPGHRRRPGVPLCQAPVRPEIRQ